MRVVHLAIGAFVALAPALAPARAPAGDDAAAPPHAAPAALPPVAEHLAAIGPAASLGGAVPEVEATSAAPRRWSGDSRWGLTVGAGFPDFATASLMFSPARAVRLWAGPSWNSLAWGLHGGIALVPWSSWIAPVLAFEAGRFFRSDLSFVSERSGSMPAGASTLLSNVDFAFAAVDLGLDLGSPRGFSLGIRAGLSYVSAAAHGTATFDSESGSGARVQLSDPSFHGVLPSAKLALQYWF